jgi:hypothetical protein
VEAVEDQLAVEDQTIRSSSLTRHWPHFSHKPSALHSSFCHPCGRSGKQAYSAALVRRDLQNSSLPQEGFGKPRSLTTSSAAVALHRFPLFQPELRVLLSFLLISYTFLPPGARIAVLLKSDGLERIASEQSGSGMLSKERLLESREVTLFSTHAGTLR